MRIAITHPYSWPDVRRGAERIIVEMSRALAARGHRVTVLTSGGSASQTVEDGVRTVRYRRVLPGPQHEHWFGWRVVPPLLRGRFDVVHSFMPWDAVSAIRTARFGGHRTVYQELGNPSRQRVERRGDRAVRERVIRDIDVFACMSEFSRGFLVRDWGRCGTVIPGGVRLSEFGPSPRHPVPTVLFSGAVDRPDKRVRELMAAIAVLADRRRDVRLVLTGPGDAGALVSSAPEAARRRTTVLPMGPPDELAADYAQAWVTCLPTLIDSFGLVVVESLACGTPVVVGPEGAPREVVQPDVGVVASSLEADALADALEAGLALAQRPGVAAACREVASRFDWDAVIAPGLERLYQSTEKL